MINLPPGVKLIVFAFALLLVSVADLAVAGLFWPQLGELTVDQYVKLGALVLLGLAVGYGAVVLCLAGVITWARGHSGSSDATTSSGTADETVALLRSINERLLISDAVKRIRYRQKEHDAIREAIREDIDQNRYDSAMVLVTQMDQVYGFPEEAQEYRQEIAKARNADMDKKVRDAVAQIDELVAKRDWENAAKEAARIEQMFPDSPSVAKLKRKVIEARDRHKRELERQFLRAAERDDVDLALRLLKELDRYLTPAEAEPFRETARGVIGKQRDNLGVRFKIALQDKDWPTAIRVGEQIVREFPNSKMADEVRDMLDVLRERAAGEQPAKP